MASPATVNSKRVSEQFRDFPKVPIRHRKILDKLARCSICDRLCCCIEHCLNHERKHSESEREKTAPGTTKTHEWVEASESTLTSRVVKSEFPFFCVYCSIKVQDEFALRHLMSHGPWCSGKKCHWMVPLAVYHEVNKENEMREIHMDVTQARGACNFPRLTPRKTPEKSLLRTALSNCLQSALRTGAAGGPLLTSTPEDDRSAAPAPAPAPAPDVSPAQAPYAQTPKATPLPTPIGILSSSPRNSKLRSSRKVTFSFKGDFQEGGEGEGAETDENEYEGNVKGGGRGDGRFNRR